MQKTAKLWKLHMYIMLYMPNVINCLILNNIYWQYMSFRIDLCCKLTQV